MFAWKKIFHDDHVEIERGKLTFWSLPNWKDLSSRMASSSTTPFKSVLAEVPDTAEGWRRAKRILCSTEYWHARAYTLVMRSAALRLPGSDDPSFTMPLEKVIIREEHLAYMMKAMEDWDLILVQSKLQPKLLNKAGSRGMLGVIHWWWTWRLW